MSVLTTTEPTAAHEATAHRRGRVPSAARRMLAAESRLLLRDPLTLTFVLAFPILTMLVIGGSFGRQPDETFPVDPAHYYVASYFTVVIAATGLIMLPVHIASYRERGVLRRFAAAGFPRWSFAFSQLVVGVVCIVMAAVLLLAVAAPVYGLPAVDDVPRVAAGLVAGSVAFVALGVLLGTFMPSARAAQAVGLLLFFPSFLLGGGGPPPAVMSDGLADVASWTPLYLVCEAVRGPWLGTGDATGDLVAVTIIAVVASVLAARRTAL